MKNLQKLLYCAICICFIACDTAEETIDPIIPNPGASLATYKVTFNFNWNAEDFPLNYPSNAHFSKLIGWSHTPSNTFFKHGTIASKGIKNMAELGATQVLIDELNTKIENNEGLESVIGTGLGSGIGEISVDLLVNAEISAITLVTMLAPSPDWYVAAVAVNLLENGAFVEEKTIQATIFDAGTDSGENFSAANNPTMPKAPIAITDYPALANGLPIAIVKFKKQ